MSDSPLKADTFAADDRLDRANFIAAVIDVIDRVEKSGDSSVFGLIGPWGSGKSSLIDAIAASVDMRAADWSDGAPWIVANFNPWMYSDAIALHTGFFSELRSAIPQEGKWEDVQERLDRLQRVVTPVAAISSIFAAGAKDASDSIFTALTVSQAEIRASAEVALRSFDQPILMVLDDLDRLTSAELLEVFKLVRFIGRLPNVYYFLSYDERTLTDLLENTDLVGSKNDGRALDYLEKIVQLRFDIPPMRIEHAEVIFSEAIDVLLDREAIVATARDRGRIEQIFASALGARFDTPRAVSRFIGQVEAFFPSVAAEVDWVDFALLSWIRTFEPALHGSLYANKTFLLGHGRPSIANKQAALDEARTQASELLMNANVRDKNHAGVSRVMSELFPAVKRALGREGRDGGSVPPGRIADADYFDRYFRFGVPDDDIADSVVSIALVDIAHGTDSPPVSKLRAQFVSNTGRTVRKIDSNRDANEVNAESLARWVGQIYPSLDDGSVGFFSDRDMAERFFARLIVEIPLAHARSVIEDLAPTNAGTYLAVEAITLLSAQEVGDQADVQRWRSRGQELVPVLSKMSREALDASSGDVFEVPRDIWVCVWRWGDVEPNSVRTYIRERIASGWSVLDVVARFVCSGVPMGVPGAVGTITGFESELVDRLIDLDWAAEQLAERLDSAPPLARHHSVEATPENRRDYALGVLRDRRHAGAAKA
jgi:hypothetical protein